MTTCILLAVIAVCCAFGLHKVSEIANEPGGDYSFAQAFGCFAAFSWRRLACWLCCWCERGSGFRE